MTVPLIKFCLVILLVKGALSIPMEENHSSFQRTTSAQQSLRCNSRSSAKKIIMSNFNATSSDEVDCRYTIRAYSLNVCQFSSPRNRKIFEIIFRATFVQLRIDFRFFHLAQPSTNGRSGKPYAHCAGEHLSISGLEFSLCGLLNNQHVYIDWDVNFQTEEKYLHFKLETNSKAIWFIEANQIECTHKSPIIIAEEMEAPRGCLQYFYKPTGYIESFNYGMSYFGNSRYAICFDKKQNNDAVLELNDIIFKMSGSNFDDSCLKDVYDEQLSEDYVSMANAEIFDGVDVRRRHSLFCGTSLNGKLVKLHAAGPIVIQVNTDKKTIDGNETGFRIQYQIKRF